MYIVVVFLFFNVALCSSNHSGHNGSIPSSASMQGMGGTGAGNGGDTDCTDNGGGSGNGGDHLLNNNTMDNGLDMCDVPDHVANQKRHVSWALYVRVVLLFLISAAFFLAGAHH